MSVRTARGKECRFIVALLRQVGLLGGSKRMSRKCVVAWQEGGMVDSVVDRGGGGKVWVDAGECCC